MRTHPFLFACAVALFACSDTITMEEYGRELEDARQCSESETCVVFNPNVACLCATIVNAKSLDRIGSRAGKVDCEGAAASCPPVPKNPRCITGVCSGDPPSTNPGDAGAD